MPSTEKTVLSGSKRYRRAKMYRTLTTTEWFGLKAWWCGCAYCHTTDRPLTKDCVLPLRRHGVYAVYNVVPACTACNSSKSGQNVFDWMRKKGLDHELFEQRWQAWWLWWVSTP